MSKQSGENLPRFVPVEKLLQYNLSTQIYNESLQVPTMENCNGFTVRNIGTSTLIVMGDALAPNETKGIAGNRGEIFVGRIDIKFSGVGINSALITQKYYMNVPRNNETL